MSKDIVPKICFPLDVETSVKLEKEKILTSEKAINPGSQKEEGEPRNSATNQDFLTVSAHKSMKGRSSPSKIRGSFPTETKEKNRQAKEVHSGPRTANQDRVQSREKS